MRHTGWRTCCPPRRGAITVRCEATASVPTVTAVRGARPRCATWSGTRTVAPPRAAGAPGAGSSSGPGCLKRSVPGTHRRGQSTVRSSFPRPASRRNREQGRVGFPAAAAAGLYIGIRMCVPPSQAHKVGRCCGKETGRHVPDLGKGGSKALATHSWPKGQCCGKALSCVRSAVRGCCTITHHVERLER